MEAAFFMLETPAKREVFVEAGRRGAEKRWGPPRVVRLDDLSPIARRIVLAAVAAAREQPEPAS